MKTIKYDSESQQNAAAKYKKEVAQKKRCAKEKRDNYIKRIEALGVKILSKRDRRKMSKNMIKATSESEVLEEFFVLNHGTIKLTQDAIFHLSLNRKFLIYPFAVQIKGIMARADFQIFRDNRSILVEVLSDLSITPDVIERKRKMKESEELAFAFADGPGTFPLDGDHKVSELKRMLIAEETCFVVQRGEPAMPKAEAPLRLMNVVREYNFRWSRGTRSMRARLGAASKRRPQ